MADYGEVKFYSARVPALEISQLGSGVADHIGFFGPSGPGEAVQVGDWQDVTMITDYQGVVVPYIGSESGKLTNTKYISSTTAQISGYAAENLININTFDPANLSTYPNFLHQNSGTLRIHYAASGSLEVHTYNARIFAYDATGAVQDAPPDVTINAFEINASGQWFNTAVSGSWKTIHGLNSALFFTNHRRYWITLCF